MLLYDLGIYLYRQGIRIAAHTSRHAKPRLLNEGLGEVWDRLLPLKSGEGRNVWIHVASLGEFEQGRPLIERLKREHPELRIILTFFSPSGYEVRKNYKEADIVAYLPIDTPRNVSRFLDIVRPEMAIFVKYEFWLNYLKELRRREIPTYLISGIFRPDQLFFKSYGGFYRNALRTFRRLYVQDERSRRLLDGIGITDVTVAGDTRFDRVTDIMRGVKPHRILDLFCKAPGDERLIFLAGSSWPEDEAVYAEWLRESGDSVKGVIAPHEFDAERLKRLLGLFGDKAVLMSEAEGNPELLEGKQVLIIDCFGLLASAYSYADIAYVGGGFGAGLHNINEAAVYGIPVFYGPNHSKFIEAEGMKTQGGGIAINSEEEFREKADRLLADPSERKALGQRSATYIRSKLGATDRIYSDLFATTANMR